jgi:hypothetical protein
MYVTSRGEVTGALEPALAKSSSTLTTPISIRQAIAFAWPAFKRHAGLFTAVLLTIFGAWVVLEVVVIAGQRYGVLLWVAAHVAFLVFFAGLEAGLIYVCLLLADGRAPTMADAFTRLALGPKFLVGQLIYLGLVGVGLLLFILPGLYAGASCALFGFSLVNREAGLVGSYRQSALLAAGAHAPLLALLVSLVVLNAIGASLLGLGLFVSVPLSVLILTSIYRQLSAR